MDCTIEHLKKLKWIYLVFEEWIEIGVDLK